MRIYDCRNRNRAVVILTHTIERDVVVHRSRKTIFKGTIRETLLEIWREQAVGLLVVPSIYIIIVLDYKLFARRWVMRFAIVVRSQFSIYDLFGSVFVFH